MVIQTRQKGNIVNPKGYILYRIWYGNDLVYLGRTKQPLQDRIRGHLLKKPMHRSININLVTKIEYAEFKSEADMNLYEIYFINLWKPALNVDDKCKDELSIRLPDVEWKEFTTHLWDKWRQEVNVADEAHRMRKEEKKARFEMQRVMRQKWHNGEISEEEYYDFVKNSRDRPNQFDGDIEDWLM